jgi:hypothetical protein
MEITRRETHFAQDLIRWRHIGMTQLTSSINDATSLEGSAQNQTLRLLTTSRKYFAPESAQLCTSFDNERLDTLHDQAWRYSDIEHAIARAHLCIIETIDDKIVPNG